MKLILIDVVTVVKKNFRTTQSETLLKKERATVFLELFYVNSEVE